MHSASRERAATIVAAFLLCAVVLRGQPRQQALAEKSDQAKHYMAEGRFADAAILYDELAKAIPGNPGLLLNLGMALHMAGNDTAAIAPLEAALKLQPIQPAMLFLGASYLRAGKPAKAIAPLKRFAVANPNHKEVRLMLADAFTTTGSYSEAVIHLRKLAEWDPSQPGVWYSLGRAYQEIAAAGFGTIPADSGYWMALAADSRNKQSQTRAGFLLYRKAIEKLPELRGLRAAVAEIYKSGGHEDWAARELELESALGAPVCRPVPTIECHFATGRYQQVLASPAAAQEARYWKIRAAAALSREAFAKLMALPPSRQSLRFRAETARDEGRPKEAAEDWRSALAASPDDASIEAELAKSLAASKDFDGAREIVSKLLAVDGEALELNFLQGGILLDLQQPEKALPFLKQAVKADQKFLPARASLGRALLLLDRAAEALPHLEASLPADSDGEIHFQLSRAYQFAGNSGLAKQMLAKYREIRKKLDSEKQMIEDESRIIGPPQVR